MKKQVLLYIISGLLLLAARGSLAEQFSFVGARAVGMGGANAASVHDATAQWHNPAAFGFMGSKESTEDDPELKKDIWEWNVLNGGAGYVMTKDMGRYLDLITDIDFDSLSQTSLSNPEEVSDLVAMAAALGGSAEEGNAFYADANMGSSMRIGHFAVGARLFMEAAAWVDQLDTANLGIPEGTDLNSDLDAVRAGDAGYAGYTPSVLSASQRSDLSAAGLSSDNIDYVDYHLNQLISDGAVEAGDVDQTADLLSQISSVTISGGGSIDSNLTAVVGRGFALAEIPVSYGYALNDNLSVGVTAKAMFGRVMGTKVWVFDEDNLDTAFESFSDMESDTINFGLDAGALYRINNFQFAVVGHNLNSPRFKGFNDTVSVNGEEVDITVPDVKIDPQVTVGAAFIPSDRLTLEIDYDILETGTLLESYDIQRISAGGEIDFDILALRLGVYKNLADAEENVVLTAGIGFDLKAFRVDIGGACAIGDSAEYDGREIPQQARLYAGIAMDF